VVTPPSYSNQEDGPLARVVLVCPVDVPCTILDDWREECRGLAGFLGGPVELCRLDGPEGRSHGVDAALRELSAHRREIIAPEPAVTAAPMGSAPFVWRSDGRPDWRAMWTSFCELALFGGPPHRGPESTLRAATGAEPAGEGIDPVQEIRRGIWETTGLYAEPWDSGWLAVTCESPRMAAWLCATIILENVEARCDEERLLVPAHPSFSLTDQVKSVITVVAKTYHYWSAHTG
jgi:sirohydrochlorin cobaltochelatase